MSTTSEMMQPADAGVPLPLDGEGRSMLPTGRYVAPRVNLLPPEVAERKALRKLQALLGVGVLLCGAAIGGLYVTSDNGRATARSNLNQATAENATLQQAKSRLLPVQQSRSKIQAARQALVSAMGSEVLWSQYLDQIRLKIPVTVSLKTLTITPAPVVATAPTKGAATPAPTATTPATTPAAGTAATAASPDLPTSGTIATVVMAGSATDNNAVADWLDAMTKIKGWTNIYLTSTTSGTAGSDVEFSATASIGSAALSHRYTDGG